MRADDEAELGIGLREAVGLFLFGMALGPMIFFSYWIVATTIM